MRISDIPDFPPRAAKALRGAGVETIEFASRFTAESLLALKGMGEKSLEDLREAGWTEGKNDVFGPEEAPVDSQSAVDLAEEVFAPPGGVPSEGCRELDDDLSSLERDMRAERFFLELCKNSVPTPQLVSQAWELARAFDQEAARDEGRNLTVYDGLRVRYQGTEWTLRTAFKPNEPKPAGMKTLALVPREG